jgi:hypothetical protein
VVVVHIEIVVVVVVRHVRPRPRGAVCRAFEITPRCGVISIID